MNITIVDDYLNKRKIRARAPSDYMSEFRDDNLDLNKTMKTHLIHDLKQFGVWNDDYDKFLRRRASLVSAELQKRIVERRDDSHEQVIRTDDLEEEMTSFE